MRKTNFLLLFIASCASLHAEDASTTSIENQTNSRIAVTDHLIFSNSKDPQDPDSLTTNLFMHEDTVRGEYGSVSADVNFTNRYATSGETAQNKIFTLEKKTITLTKDTWDLKLGDSNQEFGKGIALSLYNNSTFGVNNTLEGIATTYHPNSFKLNVMGGRVNQLRAPVAINPEANQLLAQNKNVYIAAASVGGDLGAQTKLTAQYAGVLDESEATKVIGTNSHTVGAVLEKEGLFDEVDFYAESNTVFTTKRLNGEEVAQPNSYGSYGSLVWSPLPWKAKLEFKDYRRFEREWVRVPTLEDELIVSLHNKDVSAFRAYGERKIGEARATVYSSYLIGQDREDNAVINHPIVGAKIPLPNHAELDSKVGYRWEPNRSYLFHVGGKGKLRTGKGQYVELELKKQFGRSGLDKGELYDELDKYVGLLTYTFSESFSATLGYEFVPTNEYAQGQHFPSLGANYKTGAVVARGFVGQTSGGAQCSGGMCRNVPAFTGAMAETTISF